MIVEQVGQIGFALHQLPAEIACHKGARIVHEPLARQIFKDVENLLGVFLVRDELAEVPERLERAELLRLAVGVGEDGRSEEHASELQSLMRISYAVFCLKKKTHEKTKTTRCTIQANK